MFSLIVQLFQSGSMALLSSTFVGTLLPQLLSAGIFAKLVSVNPEESTACDEVRERMRLEKRESYRELFEGGEVPPSWMKRCFSGDYETSWTERKALET